MQYKVSMRRSGHYFHVLTSTYYVMLNHASAIYLLFSNHNTLLATSIFLVEPNLQKGITKYGQKRFSPDIICQLPVADAFHLHLDSSVQSGKQKG